MATKDNPSNLIRTNDRRPFGVLEVVMGTYLRALREHRGLALDHAKLPDGMPLSQVERGEIPLRADVLTILLHQYGVESDLPNRLWPRLASALPPATAGFSGGSAPYRWQDSSPEGRSRYAAIALSADSMQHYSILRIPPGLQAPAYETAFAVGGAELLPDYADHFNRPPWLDAVRPNQGQRRAVLIDEAVLGRPVGGPAVAAAQMRHLMDLMERSWDRPETVIRIVPYKGPLCPFPADLTVLTARDFGLHTDGHVLGPSYGSNPEAISILNQQMHEAVQSAADQRRSYTMLKDAAERWEAQV
ncbi:Scr1 family TA system antitoxin-like transcriptional regulator [Streptomyces sp. NPDC056773]|uniref:Scr1 family TA system antitoxin-like transcriptional regulator n=1 Tax=unclassified Streptomyces TaxID=2593676 RepID=UPI0036B967D0